MMTQSELDDFYKKLYNSEYYEKLRKDFLYRYYKLYPSKKNDSFLPSEIEFNNMIAKLEYLKNMRDETIFKFYKNHGIDLINSPLEDKHVPNYTPKKKVHTKPIPRGVRIVNKTRKNLNNSWIFDGHKNGTNKLFASRKIENL